MSGQGFPEVPMENDWGSVRRLLVALRNHAANTTGTKTTPGQVQNFSVTPMAGANLIQFTRTDAETYTVYWSLTPSFNKANAVDIGNANRYTDNVGAGAITRWYWVRGRNNDVLGILSDPISGTTLALGTAITPPASPAGSVNASTADDTGLAIDGNISSGKYEPL